MLTVLLDARDPAGLATFWSALLGRRIEDRNHLPGTDTQPALRFVAGTTPRTGLSRIHLHLTSATDADQVRLADRARQLGGSDLDVGQLPEEGHLVLADPEGNEFCITEAGNTFLAGCGPLGELACDGSRATGLFWSAALNWPLIWDQDEETAVQSPHGGTKIAWGGPPVAPKQGRNRQRLHLTPPHGDPEAEADRLVALGATRLSREPEGIMLADPDGNEFSIATDEPLQPSR